MAIDEKKVEEQVESMDDMDVAEAANREIRQRDEEIKELKRKLAISKLYSTKEEEPEILPSKEEVLKTIMNERALNYDYAVAVTQLVDIETEAGRPNPLGKQHGDEVYQFFKDCIEDCEGDKSRFTAVYQAKIGPDAPATKITSNKIKR